MPLHKFAHKTYKKPRSCSYCKNTIWGFGAEAHSCEVCKYVVHKKCLIFANTFQCGGVEISVTPSGTEDQQPPATLAAPSTPADEKKLTKSNSNSQNSPKPPHPTKTPSKQSNMSAPELDSPMPPEDVLNEMFQALVVELDLPKDSLAYFKTPETKWTLLLQNGKAHSSAGGGTDSPSKGKGKIQDTPQYYVNSLKIEATMELLSSLLIMLRSQAISWLKQFCDIGGAAILLDILSGLEMTSEKKTDIQAQMEAEIIKIIKVIMNNKVGLEVVTQTKGSIKKIALCLGGINMDWKIKAVVLDLLTVACMEQYVPGGHKLVLDSMNYYQHINREKLRFTHLVNNLQKSGQIEMKVKYLSFINLLINEPSDIDLRMAIRTEFMHLGIADVIQELKKIDNPDLATQTEVFEDLGQEDSEEMREKVWKVKEVANVNDLDNVFTALKETAQEEGIKDVFLGMLQNLLSLPAATARGIKCWLIADRILRQIVLQRETIGTEEGYKMDLNALLQLVEEPSKEIPLTKQIKELEERAEQLKEQNGNRGQAIREKDAQIKSLTEEIEALKVHLAQTMELARISQSESDKMLQATKVALTAAKAETFLQGGNQDTHDSEVGSGPPPPPLPPGGGPAPPPPPGLKGPPPPPGKKAPPLPGAPGLPKKGSTKKIPLPNVKVKGLNWTKIAPSKIADTIFGKFGTLNDVDVDFQEIETTFAQKVIDKKNENKDDKPKQQGPVQIIDHKTSQNMAIFLSRFKCSLPEICVGIRSLDESLFERDSLKQLLPLLPSKEDTQNVNEYMESGKDASKLGKAEQFCLELQHVDNVEQRVKAFLFKLEFPAKKSELKADLEVLKLAVREIRESTQFIKVMEIILVVGNFLNGGTFRANITGFKMDALTKLGDTKGTDNKFTLMHYLAKHIERKAPQVLQFTSELSNVQAGTKVSMQTLTADVTTLGKSLTEVQSMLQNFSQEKFKHVMSEFMFVAKKDFDGLKKDLDQTTRDYAELADWFGEDPLKKPPDEFFAVVNEFIKSFEKAREDNRTAKETEEKLLKKEQDRERRRQQMEFNKQQMKEKNQDGESVVDDLLSTVREGDAFRNRRKKAALAL